jgi:Ca-activated chloride channel homolog
MKTRFAIATACLLGAALWAFGQNPPKPQAPAAAQSDEPVRISTYVTRVNLMFSVTDKKGRFVTDLVKDDFEITESKKKQTILEFASESSLPLRLGILIDTSGSIRERFRFEQEAASEFISNVVHQGIDKAMVVSFDTQAELRYDLSDDPRKINASIRDLRAGGGTALYDAIYYACRDKLAQDQPMHKFRRAIVVLSDGEDNQSHFTRDQALEMAQKAEVVIYAISTNISRTSTDGDKVLKYFTFETGGKALFPFKVEDLEQSFEDIANELRHQYNISYSPDPLVTDGLMHHFELKVKRRGDLVVRARSTYAAPKM